MIKYYKYGFGRVTDYVNEGIRSGEMTREKGIKLVERFDDSCSDNYIKSFSDYIGITVEQFWKKVRDYELSNNMKTPDIFVYSHHSYAKASRLYESQYYYNPELDGVPKPKSLEWDTNEFHLQRVKDYPKHEAFLKKYISVSASLVDRFNQLNKVRGGLTLDASTLITQASINVGSSEATKEVSKGNIVEQIKQLKELMDAGAITQEEFDKAKKKLLN